MQVAGNGEVRGADCAQLEYIARMSQELANMAYHLDRKFVAYLLNMASLAAREEAAEIRHERQATDCLAD